MKKYSYVLGDGKIPDFLAKFGLITRIGEDDDLILINSFPKMLHKVTRIMKVNGMSPIKKGSWHIGINTIQNENGEIFTIPLMPLDPKSIVYPPLINNHFVMMQILTFNVSQFAELYGVISKRRTLILDLRYNFGGEISAMSKCFEWLNAHCINQKVVLLFNNTTASAAELFIEKCQRSNLSTVSIGSETYGKKWAYKKVTVGKSNFFLPIYQLAPQIEINEYINTDTFYESSRSTDVQSKLIFPFALNIENILLERR